MNLPLDTMNYIGGNLKLVIYPPNGYILQFGESLACHTKVRIVVAHLPTFTNRGNIYKSTIDGQLVPLVAFAHAENS